QPWLRKRVIRWTSDKDALAWFGPGGVRETRMRSPSMTLGGASKAANTDARSWLPLPATGVPLRVEWPFANGIILYHLVAPLALVPIYFSWTGVIAATLG